MINGTRRSILGHVGLSILALGNHVNSSRVAAQETEYERTAEDWINEWISRSKLPIGILHLFRFKDPYYALTQSIKWKPNPDQTGYDAVAVPVGFVTDFASIPRAFWSLLRPDGPYTYPAIIHDYLYWAQDRSRDDSDEIFRLAMKDFDIETTTIDVVYRAVRLGGGPSWSSNAAMKDQGEKRILATLPDDPRTSWNDWKGRSGVFAR